MPATILPPSRRRTGIRIAGVVVVAALAGYTAHAGLANRHGYHYSALFENWLQNGILVGATVLCLSRPALVRAERQAWLCLGAGLAFWTAGNIYWSVALHGLDPTPFPSLADAGYLAFYPLAYVGL